MERSKILAIRTEGELMFNLLGSDLNTIEDVQWAQPLLELCARTFRFTEDGSLPEAFSEADSMLYSRGMTVVIYHA